jgi:ribonuclease BN (tRNA processing enzyme)
VHLKILGTRGEIQATCPHHSKKSGVLIDAQLLLDLGEKSYLDYNPKWIVLTHLHPDHAYFMRKNHKEELKTNASLYAPESPRLGIQILKRKRKIGPYCITPIPTHHSKYVISQAYLIEKDGISILYTGDMVWIDKKYHRLFKNINLVITEGSFIREGGMVKKDLETHKLYGHNGIPNLIRFFQPYTKLVLLTHFGSWFYQNVKESRKKLKDLGKKYQTTILVGYDGMSLFF